MVVPHRWTWLWLLGCGLLLAGCSRPAEQFHAYEQLEKSTQPVDPLAAKKLAEATPRLEAPSGERPASPQPGPVAEVVAVAELPVRLLLESRNRVSPAASASMSSEGDSPAIAELPEPRKVELLIPHKEFKRELGALRVSYDDLDLLKVLNMDPVTPEAPSLMPGWLKGLDGQKIRIRGFMYPPFEESGLSRFVLARDNQICCFGRNPKIYDLIAVTMKTDTTTDYIPNRPFDVVGTFHIHPSGDAEQLDQLYQIDDAIVINR